MKIYRKLVLTLGTITAVLAAGASVALANPGTLSTTTILGHRATLSHRVEVEQSGINFETQAPADVLVQTITFAPGGNSGWHFHPGLVIVVVESGTITTHNSRCETKTYTAHQSFVESGTAPFMVSNDSATDNTVVYATLIVPVGSPFRIETAAPICPLPQAGD